MNASTPLDAQALMRVALGEAPRGGRAVRPNPLVGCALLTKAGQLVSGHHAVCGGPHAERVVLDECARRGISVRGADVAVTLEPCSHQGRTGPCADALVAAGVGRVFIGGQDPNPLVRGQGIAKLQAAGIPVVEHVLTDECEALNHAWLWAHRHGRAFLTVKMAVSPDGLWVAPAGERWITGRSARAKGHELRARVDAIVTGRGTVESDDPAFTVRDLNQPGEPEMAEQPRVFVLSRTRRTDVRDDFQLKKYKVGARAERKFVDPANLEAFLVELHRDGVHDVLCEAGPQLTEAFLDAELASEIWLFVGPRPLRGPSGPYAEGRLPGRATEILESQSFAEGDRFYRLIFAPSVA